MLMTTPKPVVDECKYSETFDRIADRICDNCAANTGECECLETSCRHWGEMLELLKVCGKVDKLTDDLIRYVGKYNRAEMDYDYMLDYH